MLPGLKFLGLKGAALAAFGERPGIFDAPLTVRDAGVKLGESTLNRFLTLERHKLSVSTKLGGCDCTLLHLVVGHLRLDGVVAKCTPLMSISAGRLWKHWI